MGVIYFFGIVFVGFCCVLGFLALVGLVWLGANRAEQAIKEVLR